MLILGCLCCQVISGLGSCPPAAEQALTASSEVKHTQVKLHKNTILVWISAHGRTLPHICNIALLILVCINRTTV